jgi:ribosomal protein S3AE
MAQKTSKAAVLVKKKSWLPIIAPGLFNNQPIGEMYIDDEADPAKRRVTVSLMVLTGDPQRQNVHISLDVTKKENNQILTTTTGYSIAPAAVRKMMRRARERVDDSFVAKTKDDIAVRIKPVLITRGRAQGGVMRDVRSQMRAFIVRGVATMTFVDFIRELVAHKFQRQLQDALRKIYPLQTCELRDVHIETSEKRLKNILIAPPLPVKPAEKVEEKPAEAPVQEENKEAQTEETA